MKLINILILFLVCFCLKQLKPNFCGAENKYKTKTVKELIGSDTHFMKFGNTEEEVFVRIIEAVVDRDVLYVKSKDGKDLIIGRREPQLTDEEYFALFETHLGQNAVDQYQYKIRQAVADSFDAFYGENNRNKLVKIMQSKHLIGKKNKEMKKFWIEVRKALEDKLNTKKIVKSVLKELIPTVQTYPQEEQLAPTLPEPLI